MQNSNGLRQGFTLIEISIVLVIIGLIVGGVLVGRDLIEAAKIRAQVSQLERYSSAVNTFKAKYSSLPGDMVPNDAIKFGLPYTIYFGLAVPNGDGLYNSAQDLIGYLSYRSEHFGFWPQLSYAHLVEGGYTIGDWGGGYANYNIGTYMPAAKLNPTTGIVPTTIGGDGGLKNYWLLGLGNSDFSNEQLPSSFTPTQAYALDKKMDDGIPSSGIVRKFKMPLGIVNAQYYTGLDILNDDNLALGAYTPTNCVNTGGATYNTSNSSLACYLAVRWP